MAQRRMTSLDVIDTDTFLEMPATSQLLYFHLNSRADDDGFVSSPKKIIKIIGANPDDLKVLAVKKFIIIFNDGVCVIKHWRINNFIRKDIYKETNYLEFRKSLFIRKNGAYTLTKDERAVELPQGYFNLDCVDEALTKRQPSIGKVSIGKVSIEDSGDKSPTPQEEAKDFFTNEELQKKAEDYATSKEIPKSEIKKFILYWTEPTKTGKKQRWETEKTFEVKRRLLKWFENYQKFNQKKSKWNVI